MANTLFQREISPNYCQPRSDNNSWAIPQIQTQNKKTVQGSYRAKFQPIEILNQPDNSKGQATSLMNLQQYDKLSITMVRLEDYFLIRAQQIDIDHANILKRSIQEKRFNSQLIYQTNLQNLKAPIFPQNKKSGFPFPSESQVNIFTNGNTALENKGQTNFFSSVQSDNFQQQKQIVPNIFSSSQPQNNIFQNTQQQNQFNNNIFSQSQNNSSKTVQDQQFNIFQQKESSLNWPQQQQQTNIMPQSNQNIFTACQQQQQQQLNHTIDNFNQAPINLSLTQTVPQNIFPMQIQQQVFDQQSIQNLQYQNQLQNKAQQQQIQQPYNQQAQFQFQQPKSQNEIYQVHPIPIPQLFNPYEIMEQQMKQITKFANALNESIQAMEQIKKEEEENYLQHEKWVNQIEIQRKTDRQKKNQEFNQQQKKKNKNHSYYNNGNSAFSKIEFSNNAMKFSRINQNQTQLSQSQTQSKKNNKNTTQLIEVYFEESENFYYLNANIIEKQSKQDLQLSLMKKLDEMKIFKQNKKEYFENSEISQNENIVQENQSTIQLRIFQRVRPQLTLKGYDTIPNINQLSISQLKNVENFTIFNEYGSIQWLGQTNLLFLNLDNLVKISEQKVEVYNGEQIHYLFKPQINKKLNKTCLVTLNLPNKISEENFEQEYRFLQNKCLKQNIQLMDLDQAKQQFTVKVEHFSKYSFNHEDSEEEQDEQIQKKNENQAQVNQAEEVFQMKKRIFEQNLEDIPNQSKESTNQRITRINNQYSLQIPHFQEAQPSILNREMIEIDLRFCFFYLVTYQCVEKEIPNLFSIRLINSLYELRQKTRMNPTEKQLLTEKLQFFNILFGNPLIDIPHYIDILEIGITKLSHEDLANVKQATQNQQGLCFNNYLENIMQQRLNRDDQLSSIIVDKLKRIPESNINDKQQMVFQFLSKQPQINQQIPIQNEDWISLIICWKSNNNNIQQFTQEWWQSLYYVLDQHEIQSPEQASLMYFLSRKFSKPLDKIYEYLNQNHDPVTLFLELLIFEQDKPNKKIHKTIFTNKLSFYIENNENSGFLKLLLNYFVNEGLFSKNEIEKYYCQLSLLEQSLYFYRNSTLNNQILLQKYIYQQDYIEVGKMVLKLNNPAFQNFFKFFISFTIPILIVFGQLESLETVLKQLQFTNYQISKRDQQIISMGKIICFEESFERRVFDLFYPENIYEYQMVQILNLYYFL